MVRQIYGLYAVNYSRNHTQQQEERGGGRLQTDVDRNLILRTLVLRFDSFTSTCSHVSRGCNNGVLSSPVRAAISAPLAGLLASTFPPSLRSV